MQSELFFNLILKLVSDEFKFVTSGKTQVLSLICHRMEGGSLTTYVISYHSLDPTATFFSDNPAALARRHLPDEDVNGTRTPSRVSMVSTSPPIPYVSFKNVKSRPV